ncbi:TetR/AcrR family transcriptional regulator [Clostridium sp. 19966]|uniref:TetR/AcrR family transcriptional regulator n=1 Tax=Clostridium sp. 19966 TaxID=2768166 RepID=UPI0028E088B8|nr:TetR/AcrR family transcriptional regulator [Clostridium sp. 19966]MDT8718005.1 TetR/AcrR family transcriptional regulator [Clostridium sp. 19966]
MKNSTDSKEKILEAASRLFQVKGYNATGLNEILKESNAPKGSLYYYFPNGKEELALEAIKLASSTIRNRLKNTLNSNSDPKKAVECLIDNIIEDLKEDGRPKDISISLIALETYLTSETLREACKEAFSALDAMYSQKLIKSGIKEGIAKELGIFIQVMIEGAITVSVTQKNPEALLSVKKQIGILLSLYLK